MAGDRARCRLCGRPVVWIEFSRPCTCTGKEHGRITTRRPGKVDRSATFVQGGSPVPLSDYAAPGCSKCIRGIEHIRLPLDARRVRSYAVNEDSARSGETPLGVDLGVVYISHFVTCPNVSELNRKRGRRASNRSVGG